MSTSAKIITLVRVKRYGPAGYKSFETHCPRGLACACVGPEGDIFCKGLHDPEEMYPTIVKDIHKDDTWLLTCYGANKREGE